MESVGSASEQKLDFMNLLVTEMRNQNPLEPISHQQMAAQLAQFSQLEYSEKTNASIGQLNETMNRLNSSFEGSMILAEFNYARELIGKNVSFRTGFLDQTVGGIVEGVDFVDGWALLKVQAKTPQEDGSIKDVPYKIGVKDVVGISE